jgi:hypothetical protein
MLFSSPDAAVCGPAIGTPVTGCDPTKVSTSYRNAFYGNTMGVAPDGSTQPNGTDFWWDSFPSNTGNCWYGNHAATGRSITTSPSSLPACAEGKDPSSSIGTGDPQNEGELSACLAGFQVSGYPNGNSTLCTWTQDPAKPSARSASRVRAFQRFCAMVGANPTCAPFFGGDVAATPAADSGAWLRAPMTTRPLALFTCASWRSGSPALRAEVLTRLRHWVGGPIQSSGLVGYGTVLPDQWATQLFDARCGQPRTASIALYRLYGPAAAFAGVAP